MIVNDQKCNACSQIMMLEISQNQFDVRNVTAFPMTVPNQRDKATYIYMPFPDSSLEEPICEKYYRVSKIFSFQTFNILKYFCRFSKHFNFILTNKQTLSLNKSVIEKQHIFVTNIKYIEIHLKVKQHQFQFRGKELF